MIVHIPLEYVAGQHVIPCEGSVLHELVTGEKASIWIEGRLVTIPTPRLPVRDLVINGRRIKAVLLGPPWSLFNEYLLASDKQAARLRLEAWLKAAMRRLLQQADSMIFSGVMSYAIGTPLVPKGEVWIGTAGLNCQPKSEGLAIRWPIASSHPLQCTIRTVPGRYGIFMNDEDLVVARQGDSDGDLVFVVWLGGKPAEKRQLQFALDQIVDLEFPDIPQEIEQMDPQSLANGYSAKSLVGIATWWTWVHARFPGTDEAWMEAYDRYTPAIEAMMDGRKTGERVNLEEFGFGNGLPDLRQLIGMAYPGVRYMVATRSIPPPAKEDWRALVRQYWSLRWGPEGIDLEEVRE